MQRIGRIVEQVWELLRELLQFGAFIIELLVCLIFSPEIDEEELAAEAAEAAKREEAESYTVKAPERREIDAGKVEDAVAALNRLGVPKRIAKERVLRVLKDEPNMSTTEVIKISLRG